VEEMVSLMRGANVRKMPQICMYIFEAGFFLASNLWVNCLDYIEASCSDGAVKASNLLAIKANNPGVAANRYQISVDIGADPSTSTMLSPCKWKVKVVRVAYVDVFYTFLGYDEYYQHLHVETVTHFIE
jgi:hypothetical protein